MFSGENESEVFLEDNPLNDNFVTANNQNIQVLQPINSSILDSNNYNHSPFLSKPPVKVNFNPIKPSNNKRKYEPENIPDSNNANKRPILPKQNITLPKQNVTVPKENIIPKLNATSTSQKENINLSLNERSKPNGFENCTFNNCVFNISSCKC